MVMILEIGAHIPYIPTAKFYTKYLNMKFQEDQILKD